MTTYIALLRGINVGGKHKVPMKDLKVIFESIGYTSVKTHINSGNVIFKSDFKSFEQIQEHLETILNERFSFKIPVKILTVNDLEYVVNHAPIWWDQTNKEQYHSAIFVIPPADQSEILSVMGEPNHDLEQVQVGENVIYWSATLKTYSKSRWSKTASTSINTKVTIRTANTLIKLLELCLESSD